MKNNTNKTHLRASIFLSDLTVVDHAYIDNKGRVVGGSYNPGFIVTGEVSDDESVVVDFSTVKKDLKTHMDKHIFDIDYNGFDHKLWIIQGYSNCKFHDDTINDECRVEIITPAFIGIFPSDAIRYIKNPLDAKFSDAFMGSQFAIHLTDCLAKLYPDVKIQVECTNTTNVHLMDPFMPIEMFRYSHGLKDSTSWGCQNLAHGHFSYIQYFDNEECKKIAQDLHNAVFINAENIIHEDNDEITIEYTTSQRGYFRGTYNKLLHKIIVLSTETTIEYIGNFIKDTYNISNFYVSEGLSKGTYMG
jgi:hypothetical protein